MTEQRWLACGHIPDELLGHFEATMPRWSLVHADISRGDVVPRYIEGEAASAFCVGVGDVDSSSLDGKPWKGLRPTFVRAAYLIPAGDAAEVESILTTLATESDDAAAKRQEHRQAQRFARGYESDRALELAAMPPLRVEVWFPPVQVDPVDDQAGYTTSPTMVVCDLRGWILHARGVLRGVTGRLLRWAGNYTEGYSIGLGLEGAEALRSMVKPRLDVDADGRWKVHHNH